MSMALIFWDTLLKKNHSYDIGKDENHLVCWNGDDLTSIRCLLDLSQPTLDAIAKQEGKKLKNNTKMLEMHRVKFASES